jgi:hypothetical protein
MQAFPAPSWSTISATARIIVGTVAAWAARPLSSYVSATAFAGSCYFAAIPGRADQSPLFRQLSADGAFGVFGGVDVDVEIAGVGNEL